MDESRRSFLQSGLFGLSAIGAGLVLSDAVRPTESSGDEAPPQILADQPTGWTQLQDPQLIKPTKSNILGPYHRTGAPFRAKLTPPLAAGQTLLVCGRVWERTLESPLPVRCSTSGKPTTSAATTTTTPILRPRKASTAIGPG